MHFRESEAANLVSILDQAGQGRQFTIGAARSCLTQSVESTLFHSFPRQPEAHTYN